MEAGKHFRSKTEILLSLETVKLRVHIYIYAHICVLNIQIKYIHIYFYIFVNIFNLKCIYAYIYIHMYIFNLKRKIYYCMYMCVRLHVRCGEVYMFHAIHVKEDNLESILSHLVGPRN